MSKYLNIQQIKNETLNRKNGTVNKLVYHINRTSDDKRINTKLFRDIYDTIVKKHPNSEFMVRAQNNTQIFTLKGFNQPNLYLDDYHEYYENRVQSTKEFDYFHNIEITILK